ncbi:DoxX family protein [Stieleria sp. TO1_6]|nr:DoxX family protein [Stieleria tagensis]
MLVLLRVSIGFHFHSEGSDKLHSGTFDAAPFFANAKGPFAEQFRGLVWDHDGAVRRDPEYTRWWLGDYRDRAAQYYSFGDEENRISGEALDKLLENLDEILVTNEADLQEYELGLTRLEKLRQDKARLGVESLAGQIETVRKENDAKLKPTLVEIDQLWSGFDSTINSLAAPNQRAASPPFRLTKPRTEMIDTSVMNRYVPYFDFIVGWCLILGLFTPVAALAAAGFLASVFLSQFPPGTGPTSSYYQLVECMACLVLAGTGAGRFAGLDFFIHLFIRRSEAVHAQQVREATHDRF